MKIFIFILCFTCGAQSWTVDLEKMEILVSDVNGSNDVRATNVASAEELDKDSYEDSEYERNEDYFMENEITNIVQNGSHFLETINKTFAEYKDILKKCIHLNETREGAPGPEIEESLRDVCVPVLRNSGDVRRLITALFSATGRLRDTEEEDVKVEEELESLVRVAWLLDRLARLTDLTRPAQRGTPTPGDDSSTSPVAPAIQGRDESSEILEQAEDGRGGAGREPATPRPRRRPRRRRRSPTHPLQELTSYYLKYKTWAGSDAPAVSRKGLDVDNHLDPTTDSERSSQ